RMTQTSLNPSAGRHSDDNRTTKLASGAIPVLCQLIDDLIERRICKVGELDLCHRAKAIKGHADCRSNHSDLGQRSVENAIGAEFIQKSFGDPKYSAELRNIFTQNNDVAIAPHLRLQRVVQRLSHVHEAHGSSSRWRRR